MVRSAIPSQPAPDQGDLRAATKSLNRLAKTRRLRPAYVKAGAGLVAVCGVGIGLTVAGVGGRAPVLQVAVPVGAGQTLSADELRTVDVAADSSLGLVPASRQADVVGRVAAVPLTAGDLVTDAKIGSSSAFPPSGEAVASAALKQGAFPAELKAGDRVAVLLDPDTPAAPGTPPPAGMLATVLSVKQPDTSTGEAVVSLLTDQASALRIGQAGTSPVSVIVESPASTGSS
jgi:hypothetical protein